jgi:hypothetical protein
MDAGFLFRSAALAAPGAVKSERRLLMFRGSMAKALVGLVLVAAMPGRASAGSWQYCLGFSYPDNTAFVSPAVAEQAGAEGAFRELLERSGRRIGEVQCPRADTKETILEMQHYAIRYNTMNGVAVVSLRPGSAD